MELDPAMFVVSVPATEDSPLAYGLKALAWRHARVCEADDFIGKEFCTVILDIKILGINYNNTCLSCTLLLDDWGVLTSNDRP